MSQTTIYLFAKWKVKEGEINNVLALLAEAAIPSRAEEGNLFYKIHQGTAESNTIMLYEGYKDQAALDFHRNSEHFKTVVLGKIVPKLDSREGLVTTKLSI